MPVSLPLLLGMVYRKATWRGAMASLFCGFFTFLLFKYGFPGLLWLCTGMEVTTPFALYTGAELLVCLLVFLLDGKLSRRTPEEEEKVKEFFAQFEEMG